MGQTEKCSLVLNAAVSDLQEFVWQPKKINCFASQVREMHANLVSQETTKPMNTTCTRWHKQTNIMHIAMTNTARVKTCVIQKSFPKSNHLQEDIHSTRNRCSCQDPGSEPPGNGFSADESPSMKYFFAATIRSNLSAPGSRITRKACTERAAAHLTA